MIALYAKMDEGRGESAGEITWCMFCVETIARFRDAAEAYSVFSH